MNSTAAATYIGNFEMREPDGSVRPVTKIEMDALAGKKRIGLSVIQPATADECISTVRERLESVPAFLQFQRSA